MEKQRVCIGLPTYNRPDLLREALASLLSQTHYDIEIIVSDNASPGDQVKLLVGALAERDARIKYVRHNRNMGAAANFKYVVDAADAPYFMWASDDDLWEPDFVARCLDLLDKTPAAQMAFGGIVNINTKGETIRAYPGFSRFTASGNRMVDAQRFVAEPDVLGKANLVYGLFRTDALKSVIDECWESAGFLEWGGDVVLMFAFLCRHPIVTIDQVFLKKRIPIDSSMPLEMRNPYTYLIPIVQIRSFIRRHVAVAPEPSMKKMVVATFSRRLIAQKTRAALSAAFWMAVFQRGARRVGRALKR
jgi:glycosyltransferase involved in cell wall biosynthesis